MVKILFTWYHVKCSILSIFSGCAISRKIFLGLMERLQTENRKAKNVQQNTFNKKLSLKVSF